MEYITTSGNLQKIIKISDHELITNLDNGILPYKWIVTDCNMPVMTGI